MDKINQNKGIFLLKKGKHSFLHIVFSRFGIAILLLLLQVLILLAGFMWFQDYRPHIETVNIIISVFMVIYLVNCRMDPSAKITWLVIVLLAPIVGPLFFLYTQADLGHRSLKRLLGNLHEETKGKIPQRKDNIAELKEQSVSASLLPRYLYDTMGFPLYDKTEVKYFPLGEDKFKALLEELENARHFIFMEYFIIKEGEMWGELLEVLSRKAEEGVDVRVMYDGTCEINLSHSYPKLLHKLGIKCRVFSPLRPFLSTHYNYRDHRKITVIDGHTAFTGGVNLADEYINVNSPYGHWKDTAVMIKGEAVKTFTLLFLELWHASDKHTEFDKFLSYNAPEYEEANGYVLPYGDTPLDDNKTGERVYMNILNHAEHYVHIMSPYLILDSELETAIKFAAERGVDVSIILPGIPDKAVPYALAKSHYSSLIDSGVNIYEYSPGFIHAKSFVSDDREAVVGTINCDYRSLYHHFECGMYMYETDCISDIEADFRQTLRQCRKVTNETIKKENIFTKLTGWLMKAFAPLL